jgi:hypothetical protein
VKLKKNLRVGKAGKLSSTHLKDGPEPALHSLRYSAGAFSLLEVMIAMALFFMAVFAILELTSQSLASARRLQTSNIDVSGLAAAMSLTNRLEEGGLPQQVTAEFEQQHPGYSCSGSVTEVSTNGLFQVDFEIYGVKGKRVVASSMSILLYRPGSGSRSFGNKLRR